MIEPGKYLIGIDAGFTHTGISIFKVDGGVFKFQECKTFVTSKSEKKKQLRVADDDADRIQSIIRRMSDMLKPYLDYPCMLAVELPTGGSQSARATRTMALITGAIVAFIAIYDMPAEWITPNDVKIAVVGNKNATKDQMMDRVRQALSKHSDKLPKTKD